MQVFVRMLGICAPPTTDLDPASVIPDKKRKFVTTVFSLVFFLFLFTHEMVFRIINDLHLQSFSRRCYEAQANVLTFSEG